MGGYFAHRGRGLSRLVLARRRATRATNGEYDYKNDDDKHYAAAEDGEQEDGHRAEIGCGNRVVVPG
jgi:hypothetical protein